MKLAEALIERKAATGKITELVDRYAKAVIHEQDIQPDEAEGDVRSELEQVFAKFQALTVDLNTRNMEIRLPSGLTLMESIVLRDSLKSQIAHYRKFVDTIRGRNEERRNRWSAATVAKMVIAPTVNLEGLQSHLDKLSQQLRNLDASIQEANWKYEL